MNGAVVAATGTLVVPAVVVASLLVATATRALPPAPVTSTADGVVVVAAVATGLALGALPAGGLVVVPLLPLPAACLCLGFAVRVRGGSPPGGSVVWIPVAIGTGALALFARGVLVGDPEFLAHVVRPPSLLGASLALSTTTLAFFPLGRTAREGSPRRWPLAGVVVAVPPATVLVASTRSFDLAGPLLPVVFALVAVLLGVPLFRLGHAVGERGP